MKDPSYPTLAELQARKAWRAAHLKQETRPEQRARKRAEAEARANT